MGTCHGVADMNWRITSISISDDMPVMAATLHEYDDDWKKTGREVNLKAKTLVEIAELMSPFQPDNLGAPPERHFSRR